jgi:hypothetical protein
MKITVEIIHELSPLDVVRDEVFETVRELFLRKKKKFYVEI